MALVDLDNATLATLVSSLPDECLELIFCLLLPNGSIEHWESFQVLTFKLSCPVQVQRTFRLTR